ncbi:hypothetical protein SAMN06295912_106121 [Sphingomonas laterariae]|uniref:Uncharacterized protein n=1 Tax=Edaphosphingomonas laterariae TaxID=861865 RepID=A0A239EFU4_9SPHN|nr:hypothetical protein SAMN06295912_106121 [Sphingomonas laterariae]
MIAGAFSLSLPAAASAVPAGTVRAPAWARHGNALPFSERPA